MTEMTLLAIASVCFGYLATDIVVSYLHGRKAGK